jgi:hypothetical protein
LFSMAHFGPNRQRNRMSNLEKIESSRRVVHRVTVADKDVVTIGLHGEDDSKGHLGPEMGD